jgi:ribosomal protein L11 methylase PrmA
MHTPACLLSSCLQAYQRAIERAVKQRQQQDGEAHVLDMGCGTGVLSLLAARAGQWQQ